MYWEKEIRIRLTTRRILGGILATMSVVNLFIVGAVVNATTLSSSSTPTSTQTTPPPTDIYITPSPRDTKVVMTPTSAPTNTETQTPTSTPTSTVTPTASFTVTPSPLSCTPWTHWLTYVVQSGDTLYSLAQDTGTTVEELMLANCLYDNRIYVGQILYVPRFPIKPPTITPPETVSPSPTPCSPKTSWPTYIVQEGDKLSSLANATHTTEWALMQANCLSNDYIYPGQLLHLPFLAKGTQTPTPGPAQTDIPIATPTNTQRIYLTASPSYVPPLFKVTN